MKPTRRLALLLGAALCLVAVAAQEKTENKTAGKATRKTVAKNDIVKPAPEMEKLIHALAGTWSSIDTYDPSEMMPEGGTAHSRNVFRPGPGRFSLIEEYHGDGSAGKSSGIGIIWWDDKAQGFRVVWCEAGDPPVESRYEGCSILSNLGKWEGNQYVHSDEREIQGKRVVLKEVFSDFTPLSFTQTIYIGEPGGELKRFLTVRNKRLTKPSAVSKRQPAQ